ncbi:hypothetical protein SALBM135S_05087 [Streptomyces alboniger]
MSSRSRAAAQALVPLALRVRGEELAVGGDRVAADAGLLVDQGGLEAVRLGPGRLDLVDQPVAHVGGLPEEPGAYHGAHHHEQRHQREDQMEPALHRHPAADPRPARRPAHRVLLRCCSRHGSRAPIRRCVTGSSCPRPPRAVCPVYVRTPLEVHHGHVVGQAALPLGKVLGPLDQRIDKDLRSETDHLPREAEQPLLAQARPALADVALEEPVGEEDQRRPPGAGAPPRPASAAAPGTTPRAGPPAVSTHSTPPAAKCAAAAPGGPRAVKAVRTAHPRGR